ncbi:MAG TPA: sugar phosphate nucleotidyltransferase [Acidobacteriota bacterium]|nr:sugar phosphate nucleotidyltransferase [Acidobacteriota bacterium]
MSGKAHLLNREHQKNNFTTAAPLHHVSLLLAGGDGRRLQAFTKEVSGTPIPKQYCRLLHGSSLLEATLFRTSFFSQSEKIYVIVNRSHLELAGDQLSMIPDRNILIQPLNRDTGPGLIFSLFQIEQLYSDAIVAVFPTDHYVSNDRAFIAHVLRAAEIISSIPEKIAILGIAPDRPEPGYGYILPAGTLGTAHGVYRVEAFMEKPDPARADHIIAKGGLWNTFVMVFRLSRMIELLKIYVPDEFKEMAAVRDRPDKAEKIYASLVSWNLSRHFLSLIPEHLIALEISDVDWSDWGTRESIERTYQALNIIPFWNLPDALPDQVAS